MLSDSYINHTYVRELQTSHIVLHCSIKRHSRAITLETKLDLHIYIQLIFNFNL